MAAVTARRLAWKRNEVDVLRVSRWNTRNAVELPTRPNTIRNPMSRDDITNEYSRHPGSSSDAGSAPAVVVSQSASPASLTSRWWAWRIVTSSVVIVSSFSFNLRSTVPTHAMLPWMGLLHSTAQGILRHISDRLHRVYSVKLSSGKEMNGINPLLTAKSRPPTRSGGKAKLQLHSGAK